MALTFEGSVSSFTLKRTMCSMTCWGEEEDDILGEEWRFLTVKAVLLGDGNVKESGVERGQVGGRSRRHSIIVRFRQRMSEPVCACVCDCEWQIESDQLLMVILALYYYISVYGPTESPWQARPGSSLDWVVYNGQCSHFPNPLPSNRTRLVARLCRSFTVWATEAGCCLLSFCVIH